MSRNSLDNLKGKRVLLLAPSFFHYVDEIKAAFQEHEIHCTYMNDRAKDGFLWKIISRYTPSINESFANRELEELCQERAYDYFIIIKGESVSQKMIDTFKRYNPESPIYLYLWDSVKNSSHAFKYRESFNGVFSFDTEDAKKYNLDFLPLFVGMQYDPVADDKELEMQYDMMFVGTAHSIRSKVLNQVEVVAKRNGLSFFDYRFVQNKLIYAIRFLTSKDFRKTPKGLLHLDVISAAEVKKTLIGSKVMVDVTHPGQSGLTGRVIEALSMGRKVVTNNERIRDYHVIDMRDVLILPSQMNRLDRGFIESPFYGDSEEIYRYFSVETWLSKILLP